jgi:hypothetical protein
MQIVHICAYFSAFLAKKRAYSERQKYGINSLKIKHNFFQKKLWTGQF